MESAIVSSLPQLGVAGAAILVMYLMYRDNSARNAEKDKLLIAQVDKHEATMKEHQVYLREAQHSTLIQLNHASKVIEDNIKSHERVVTMLDKLSK